MLKKFGLIGLVALVAIVALAVFAFPLAVSAERALFLHGMGRGPVTSTTGCDCLGTGTMGGYGGRGMGMMRGGTLVSETAKLTGLSTTEVISALQSGQTFAQIAAAHDVSKEKLVAAVVAERKAVLDAKVKDGTLTQEQADAMLTQIQTRVTAEVDETHIPGQGMMNRGGGMRGGQGGRGRGGHGMMGGWGNAATATPQP